MANKGTNYVTRPRARQFLVLVTLFDPAPMDTFDTVVERAFRRTYPDLMEEGILTVVEVGHSTEGESTAT